MRRIHGALGVVLALAACQPTGLTPPKKVTPKPAESVTAAASSTPSSPAASGSPATQVAASPAWDKAVKLVPPSGESTTLSGVIKMDPSYIVAAGAGNLVASGAGNIVAAGGGNIVAAGGGNLQVGGRIVAAGGGNIVAAGAGNIISGNASAVVAAGAGNIIASGAGNIVAAGAGNIISGNAGAVISGNASARHVFDAAAPARDPIPGAGMLVSVLSLRTHQYLSLGKYTDAEGKLQDVYSIYTNADGAYKLYLPPGEDGNVMVVASPPGQTNDDRMIYNVVSQAKAHDEPIDEDAALAGRYLHFAFSGRIAEVLREGRPGAKYVLDLIANEAGLPQDFQGSFKLFLDSLVDEAAKYDVPHWKNPKDIDDLATSFTDVALSYVDPHAMITAKTNTKYQGPEEEAVAAMAASLKVAREATIKKLAAEPTFFLTHKFPFQDNCNNPTLTQLDVKKTTDPGDYLVSHYLTTNVVNGFFNVHMLFDALEVPKVDPVKDVGQQERMEAVAYVVLQEIIKNIASHPDVFGEVERFCTRPGFKPELDAARTPAPVPTCTPFVNPGSGSTSP